MDDQSLSVLCASFAAFIASFAVTVMAVVVSCAVDRCASTPSWVTDLSRFALVVFCLAALFTSSVWVGTVALRGALIAGLSGGA